MDCEAIEQRINGLRIMPIGKEQQKKMKRLLISITVIAILVGIAEYFFPWWALAAVAFVVVMVSGLRGGRAFMAGFGGVALLWLIVSLVKDIRNEHILSSRMAELFSLPHPVLYLVVAAIVGGLVGGLAGWSGAVVRKTLF